MIDMETFIQNFQTSHPLEPEETKTLLELFQKCGLTSFSHYLSKALRENCYRQMKDKYENPSPPKMLPIICTDSNLRSYKEKTTKGWHQQLNDQHLDNIVNIAGKQVYQRHQKPVYVGIKSRKQITNIIKRDHSIERLHHTLLECGENSEKTLDNDALPIYQEKDKAIYFPLEYQDQNYLCHQETQHVFLSQPPHTYVGMRMYDSQEKEYFISV